MIRETVKAAANRVWECVGLRDGFDRLLWPESYPRGGLMALPRDRVRGISRLGGTMLGNANDLRYKG